MVLTTVLSNGMTLKISRSPDKDPVPGVTNMPSVRLSLWGVAGFEGEAELGFVDIEHREMLRGINLAMFIEGDGT